MKSIRIHAIAAATALFALAAPSVAQVSDYKEIKTPPLHAMKIEQPKRIELANGMVIFLMEDHELPLIRGSARIRGGASEIPANKAGLAGIYAQVWRTGGTQSKTGDELDDFLEARAAHVEPGAGEDSTSLGMNILRNDFDAVFPIFVDLLQHPAFRQEKIDLAKNLANTGISRRNDDPGGITGREASKLGYGADSPYVRQPEYATIASITRDDLVAFHDKFVHPNSILLGFVGDFDSAAMEQKLRAAFGSWPRGPQAAAVNAPPHTAKPGVYFIAKDDVTQANIAMVEPGTTRRNPDFYAITMMNEILSGGFSGRLMNHIRSAKGLAYGVGGGLGMGWDHPTLFTLRMSTKSGTTVESIDALRSEVNDLITKPVTAEEMKLAKQSIANSFIFTMDSKSKILNERMTLEFYGYPADWYQQYIPGIEKVTAADVERVAKKYVNPTQLAVLVVGNEKDFDKPLKTLGDVTPIDITIPEATSSTPKAAAGAAPAATSAEGSALIRKVQDFVGGKTKIDAVQATHMAGTVQAPQGEIEIDIVMRYPDSMRQTMTTPMGQMTTVLTPEAAFMLTPMGPRDIPSSQRDMALRNARLDIISVLKNASNPAWKFTVVGTEKIGDVNAQVLEISGDKASGKWYVDPATGRLLRKVSQGQMGEQFTDYKEWKQFDGINLPVAANITSGGQSAGALQVKTIEINPAIDPKTFAKPEK